MAAKPAFEEEMAHVSRLQKVCAWLAIAFGIAGYFAPISWIKWILFLPLCLTGIASFAFRIRQILLEGEQKY